MTSALDAARPKSTAINMPGPQTSTNAAPQHHRAADMTPVPPITNPTPTFPDFADLMFPTTTSDQPSNASAPLTPTSSEKVEDQAWGAAVRRRARPTPGRLRTVIHVAGARSRRCRRAVRAGGPEQVRLKVHDTGDRDGGPHSPFGRVNGPRDFLATRRHAHRDLGADQWLLWQGASSSCE
jgi:hypothetical protein